MEMDVAELMQRMAADDPGCVLLDVREVPELAAGPLPGAINLPMSEIERRVGELDKTREIICYCEHGIRSMNVAGWLAGQGFRVRSLRGGYAAWPGPRAGAR